MEFCFESAEAIYLPLFKFLIRLTFAAIFYQGVVEIYLGRVSTEHFSLQHVNITAVFKKGYSSCLWPVCHRKRELYSETFSWVNKYLWSLFSFETMIMLTSRRPPVSHAWLMCACQCKNVVWAPVCVFSHLLNVHRRNNLKIGKTESVCSIFIYLKAPKNENGSVHC